MLAGKAVLYVFYVSSSFCVNNRLKKDWLIHVECSYKKKQKKTANRFSVCISAELLQLVSLW